MNKFKNNYAKSGYLHQLIKIPALSENAFLRYISFSALYVAQGIPEGLTLFAIPAWLAMNGGTPGQIASYVAIAALPWSFKILAAPVMDRFTLPAMGRRRPWILFGQSGLILAFLSMSLISDPVNNVKMLMIASFSISLFSVFQDVAVDGLAIDILPSNEQARANGLMWGSKTLGISTSIAAGNWLINTYSFPIAIISLSSLVLLIMLIPLGLRERPGEKLLPWTRGEASKETISMQIKDWRVIFKSLYKVFFLPVSLFMGFAAFSFSIGRGLMDASLPVFSVQELGWTDTEFSAKMATSTIIAGLSGMFIGGALVDFFGKKRMISIYLIMLMATVTCFVLLKNLWPNKIFISAFVIVFYTIVTFTSIAIFATAMRLCWKKISATQFTAYMAVSNLGLSAGAALMGVLNKFLSWDFVLLSYTLFALFMLIMVRFINFESHQNRMNLLEKENRKYQPVDLIPEHFQKNSTIKQDIPLKKTGT